MIIFQANALNTQQSETCWCCYICYRIIEIHENRQKQIRIFIASQCSMQDQSNLTYIAIVTFYSVFAYIKQSTTMDVAKWVVSNFSYGHGTRLNQRRPFLVERRSSSSRSARPSSRSCLLRSCYRGKRLNQVLGINSSLDYFGFKCC